MDCCTEERGWHQDGDNNCFNGKGRACEGIRLVREGACDVAQGLKEIEKAKSEVGRAIDGVENALKHLRCVQKELENAGRDEAEGLKDINTGICLIEDELKKPICLPPICH
jgi:hypothetical protein